MEPVLSQKVSSGLETLKWPNWPSLLNCFGWKSNYLSTFTCIDARFS